MFSKTSYLVSVPPSPHPHSRLYSQSIHPHCTSPLMSFPFHRRSWSAIFVRTSRIFTATYSLLPSPPFHFPLGRQLFLSLVATSLLKVVRTQRTGLISLFDGIFAIEKRQCSNTSKIVVQTRYNNATITRGRK